jgi:hypothetical protein
MRIPSAFRTWEESPLRGGKHHSTRHPLQGAVRHTVGTTIFSRFGVPSRTPLISQE